MSSRNKLAKDINRILFVKNLNYEITGDELYELFGKFGTIRQIRLGNSSETKGTAFIVYEYMQDAKLACEKLSGFNFQNRYLVVLFFQPEKVQNRHDIDSRYAALERLKRQYGIE